MLKHPHYACSADFAELRAELDASKLYQSGR
jgi:hypothetical protein